MNYQNNALLGKILFFLCFLTFLPSIGIAKLCAPPLALSEEDPPSADISASIRDMYEDIARGEAGFKPQVKELVQVPINGSLTDVKICRYYYGSFISRGQPRPAVCVVIPAGGTQCPRLSKCCNAEYTDRSLVSALQGHANSQRSEWHRGNAEQDIPPFEQHTSPPPRQQQVEVTASQRVL